MLESLYTEAIKKKGTIIDQLDKYKESNLDISKFWDDYNIPESNKNFTIGAGDGSKSEKKFLSFYFYAVSAESLIYNEKNSKDNLLKIESSDVNTMDYGKFSKDRIRNYMGLFEVKNALKAIKSYDIDYYLYDGSLLGDLIRPYPLETEISQDIRFDVLDFAEDELNKEINTIENHNVEVYSNNLVANALKNKFDKIRDNNDYKYLENILNYLENIEKLLVLANLLKYNDKIIAISKSSQADDYFKSNIPDMALFDKFTQGTGYSYPKIKPVSDEKLKREFPVEDSFFKSLIFTIFYVRLEENKNILKIELPYKANKSKVEEIIEIISKDSTGGYPYLLKKAHHDVVIKNRDIEHLSKIIGIYEKTGREML